MAQSLLNEICNSKNDVLIDMGFVEEHDGSGDPRGTDWNIRNDHFHLWVDPWADVFLKRINPDTDAIKLIIEDLQDLKCVIDWIAPNYEKVCPECKLTDYHSIECKNRMPLK